MGRFNTLVSIDDPQAKPRTENSKESEEESVERMVGKQNVDEWDSDEVVFLDDDVKSVWMLEFLWMTQRTTDCAGAVPYDDRKTSHLDDPI